MSVSIIQQSITAGGNFDATLPGGTPTLDKDIKRFAAAAAGGLFDFEITGPHRLMAVELILGGQSAWTIHKKDSDGDEILLWQGTTEAFFVTLSEDTVLVYEGEQLLVRTTGASTAMKAKMALARL